MKVAKVIELVGESEKSFDDAIENALRIASESLRNIHGLDVISMNAKVKDGKISIYRAVVKVAFGYERE